MTVHLCDTNVWLALALSGHAHHERARTWFDTVDTVGSIRFCRATQQSLLRLLTSAAVFAPYQLDPLTNRQAWEAYVALASDDRVRMRTGEPAGIEATWRALASRRTASPKLWMDAYLAAFALEDGAQLVTIDKAFTQFDGLDVLLLA